MISEYSTSFFGSIFSFGLVSSSSISIGFLVLVCLSTTSIADGFCFGATGLFFGTIGSCLITTGSASGTETSFSLPAFSNFLFTALNMPIARTTNRPIISSIILMFRSLDYARDDSVMQAYRDDSVMQAYRDDSVATLLAMTCNTDFYPAPTGLSGLQATRSGVPRGYAP